MTVLMWDYVKKEHTWTWFPFFSNPKKKKGGRSMLVDEKKIKT